MKIDKFGNYLSFPGVTIIAPVLLDDRPFWHTLHARLMACKHLPAYFAPLPSESYHMTTNNLFTQLSDGDDDWPGVIDRALPILQQMHVHLTECAFAPAANVQSFIDKGAIQLVLELTPEQVNTIETLAKKFGIEWGIPQPFHMTLAYQFKYMDPEMAEIIRLEIKSTLDEVFRTHANVIQLQTPQLHIFHDMTEFTRWDASSNPFLIDEMKPSFR